MAILYAEVRVWRFGGVFSGTVGDPFSLHPVASLAAIGQLLRFLALLDEQEYNGCSAA